MLCLIWVIRIWRLSHYKWIELIEGPLGRVTQLNWALITHLRGEAYFSIPASNSIYQPIRFMSANRFIDFRNRREYLLHALVKRSTSTSLCVLANSPKFRPNCFARLFRYGVVKVNGNTGFFTYSTMRTSHFCQQSAPRFTSTRLRQWGQTVGRNSDSFGLESEKESGSERKTI